MDPSVVGHIPVTYTVTAAFPRVTVEHGGALVQQLQHLQHLQQDAV